MWTWFLQLEVKLSFLDFLSFLVPSILICKQTLFDLLFYFRRSHWIVYHHFWIVEQKEQLIETVNFHVIILHITKHHFIDEVEIQKVPITVVIELLVIVIHEIGKVKCTASPIDLPFLFRISTRCYIFDFADLLVIVPIVQEFETITVDRTICFWQCVVLYKNIDNQFDDLLRYQQFLCVYFVLLLSDHFEWTFRIEHIIHILDRYIVAIICICIPIVEQKHEIKCDVHYETDFHKQLETILLTYIDFSVLIFLLVNHLLHLSFWLLNKRLVFCEVSFT